MNDKDKKEQNKKIPFTGIGLIFGTAIGAGLSIILTGNTLIWAGIGTALGLIAGAMVDSVYRK